MSDRYVYLPSDVGSFRECGAREREEEMDGMCDGEEWEMFRNVYGYQGG